MIKLDQKPKFGHLRQIKFDVKRVTQITTGDDKKKHHQPGTDLGFSRGGGGFSKKKSKILTTFFLG